MQTNHGLDLSSINANAVFTPVVPLFEEKGKDDNAIVAAGDGESDALVPVDGSQFGQVGPSLTLSDLNQFLLEQKRSLGEKCADLAKVFPDGEKLITVAEANVLVTVLHGKQVAQYYADGVDYIEDMLRKQLISAIGKVVTPVDFANYMVFHNRKLFREAYQPQPFSYAIRRPDHYPEGVLSIEGQLADGSMADPIYTIVSHSDGGDMKFAIDAATTVSFSGECHLHAWIDHRFSGASGQQLSLNARARQFSSFLVLVGRIGGPGLFDPKFGMIVQNKDDIKIPLEMETIPTPKEFADAIESLSPEQQRFAKAFRSMQLASTLFGVCVIQIKPQLEKVLKLPNDALTKEIKLTQELMELFIKYQIPSDLLSFGGKESQSDAAKLQEVKTHVKAMYDMINESKQKEIEEVKQEAHFSLLDNIKSSGVKKRQEKKSVPAPPMAVMNSATTRY